MRRFNYKAKDAQGRTLKGKVEAPSDKEAARLVREKGLVVIEVTPERETPLTLINRFLNRITASDVATFTRQLSTMIGAGLPITDALVIIRAQAKSNLKPVVGQILTDVEGGSSLSEAFAKHPQVFSPIYISLLRAGEKGGVLDEVLARLADNLESQREFRSKVKGALIYPAIIIIGMVLVAFIMLVFVIPRLNSLYSDFGAELPLATKILVAVSGFATRYWWLSFFILAFIFWGLLFYRKTPGGRRRIDRIKFRTPVTGDLNKQIALAEFSRTLGLLVGAGVSLIESLRIVAGAVGNLQMAESIEQTAKDVEKGFPVAYALSQRPEMFPPLLTQMVAVGEETGKLDEVLQKVAHIYELESEQSVKGLTAAIEPLVMIILGVGVGFLAIAVIMPIYNLTSQF